MTMKRFMRMLCLLRANGINLRYFNTHNESTWSKSISRLSMQRFNRQYRHDNNGNCHQEYLICGSVGFLGFFGLNEKEESSPESEMTMTIKRSIFLMQKGELEKAEQMLHVALRQAQTIRHENGITYIYDLMGNLALEAGENKKSKDLFTVVMQRLISSGTPENDRKIISISLKMAMILVRMGDIVNAEEGFKYCLTHIEPYVANYPDDNDIQVLYMTILNNYGTLLYLTNRAGEAHNYLSRAYEIAVIVNGKNNEKTLVKLNNLAVVNLNLGEYDRALNYVTDAIEIGNKFLDKEILSSFYNNLGKVYIKKMLYDEAKKACTESLKLAKEYNNGANKKLANDCLEQVENILNK